MEISVNNKSTIDFIDGENIFSVDFLSVSKEKSVTKNSEAANLKLLKEKIKVKFKMRLKRYN